MLKAMHERRGYFDAPPRWDITRKCMVVLKFTK